MLPGDSVLSFLNDMLHQPSVFRYDKGKNKFTCSCSVSRTEEFDVDCVSYSSGYSKHCSMQAALHKQDDFLVFLVFKLLERGICIAARNVCFSECAHAMQIHPEPTPCAIKKQKYAIRSETKTAHTIPELGLYVPPPVHDYALTPDRQKKLQHCDFLAFHPKKRHIFAITVCKDETDFVVCRKHALRLADTFACKCCMKPSSVVFYSIVLTVYDFENTGAMRFCTMAVHAFDTPS